MHFVTCKVCNFFPAKKTRLTQRQKQLEEHYTICKYLCKYCKEKIPSQRYEAHGQSCPKRSITCHDCNEELLLLNYTEHVIKKLKNRDDQIITCPCCRYSIPGIDYFQHHKTLHSERKQQCPYCSEIFFNGALLWKHTLNHPAKAMELMFMQNEDFLLKNPKLHEKNLLTIKNAYRLICQFSGLETKYTQQIDTLRTGKSTFERKNKRFIETCTRKISQIILDHE